MLEQGWETLIDIPKTFSCYSLHANAFDEAIMFLLMVTGQLSFHKFPENNQLILSHIT